MTTEAIGAQAQQANAEVANATGCKNKNLVGLRGCEHQHSQSPASPITNLSSYSHMSELMFMFVCLSALIF